MCRFRSGSAGVAEELARYGGGGEGVWEEDGTEKKKSAICKACNSNCIETIEHVLFECSTYNELRVEWKNRVLDIVGSGPSPLNLMLGGKLPGVGEDGRLSVLAVSTSFLVMLWSTRATKIHGQRADSLGVNDVKHYGIK